MAFSTVIRSSDGVPISQAYLPGTGFIASKASPNTNTDGSGNLSTAIAIAADQSIVLTAVLQNAQAGSANGAALTMTGMGSVLFEVSMAGFTGTVNFEGAGPNANYDPLFVAQEGTNTVVTTVTGAVTTSTHLYELANASGLASVRARTSGAAAGTVTVTAYALPMPAAPRVVNANQAGTWLVSTAGGTKATYTYAVTATAPYATPQDWIVIRGSGTKTVKILRVELSGAATAATEVLYTLKKHTIANTAGTSTTPTPMQHDSADGAPTATVLLYTVLPTISGTATVWKTVRMTLAVAPAASTVAPDRYVYDYSDQAYEPLTLRGVAQEFAVNLGGVALPAGAVLDVSVTFSEE